MTVLFFFEMSHVEQFFTFLNSRHVNIKYTFETEKDFSLPHLGVNINRVDSNFTTSW